MFLACADDDGALDHQRVVSTFKTNEIKKKKKNLTLASSETEYLLTFERQLVETLFVKFRLSGESNAV